MNTQSTTYWILYGTPYLGDTQSYYKSYVICAEGPEDMDLAETMVLDYCYRHHGRPLMNTTTHPRQYRPRWRLQRATEDDYKNWQQLRTEVNGEQFLAERLHLVQADYDAGMINADNSHVR